MVSPTTRFRLQAVAVCTAAGLLFMASLSITFTGFLTWHILTTRPRHSLPLYFSPVDETSTTRTSLHAFAHLQHVRGLRSVQKLTASLRLVLPESRANLDNPVLHLSAELFGRPGVEVATQNATKEEASLSEPAAVCLERSSAQAALRFRSPVHRAIRAVALFVPLLLGITEEYQTVRVRVLLYRAAPAVDGRLPLLDGIRVRLWPAEVQVSDATLKLKVVRRSFVGTMVRERRVSTFLVIAIGIWYAMLFGLFLTLAVFSALRRAMRHVWQTVLEAVELDPDVSVDPVAEVDASRPQVSAARPPRFPEAGEVPSHSLQSRQLASQSALEKDGLRKRSLGRSGSSG